MNKKIIVLSIFLSACQSEIPGDPTVGESQTLTNPNKGGIGSCNTDAVCISSTCVNYKCVEATCRNGVKDSDEGGVDCGVQCNAPCENGQSCRNNADCQSMFCYGNICYASHCTDGSMGGDETDVDCGKECPPCIDGKLCAKNSECQSGCCENTRPQTCTRPDTIFGCQP